MVKIVYNRNNVYQVAYHVVWCVKYRKPVLAGSISEKLSELIESICDSNGWVVISKEIQPNHIHLFATIPPSTSIATAVKKLKGITARKLCRISSTEEKFVEWFSLVSILLCWHSRKC